MKKMIMYSLLSLFIAQIGLAANPQPGSKTQIKPQSTSEKTSQHQVIDKQVKSQLGQKTSNDFAIFEQLLSSLEAAEKKAGKLTYDFNEEYSILYDENIDKITSKVMDSVFRKDVKPPKAYDEKAGKKKSIQNVIGWFKSVFKIEKNDPQVLPKIGGDDFVESPLGAIKMSEKMKNILNELAPIEKDIDDNINKALVIVSEIPHVERAKLIGIMIDINLRRSFRSLHSEVFGLRGNPECKGDIAADGLVMGTMVNFLSGKFQPALENLFSIANQMTCISGRQSKQFDAALLKAYDDAVIKYKTEKKNGPLQAYQQVLPGTPDDRENDTIKIVDSAFFNIALLVYDFNKASFSVLYNFIGEKAPKLAPLYKPGKPMFDIGVYLYDRKNATLVKADFKPSAEVDDFQFKKIDKAIIKEGYNYYGARLVDAALSFCKNGKPYLDPVIMSEVSFQNFAEDAVTPLNIAHGVTGLPQTAAVGVPDTFGLCGIGSGGGVSGGSIQCTFGSGGGGSPYECMDMVPVPQTKPLSEEGAQSAGTTQGLGTAPEIPVDIARMRAAALCGSNVGDDLDMSELDELDMSELEEDYDYELWTSVHQKTVLSKLENTKPEGSSWKDAFKYHLSESEKGYIHKEVMNKYEEVKVKLQGAMYAIANINTYDAPDLLDGAVSFFSNPDLIHVVPDSEMGSVCGDSAYAGCTYSDGPMFIRESLFLDQSKHQQLIETILHETLHSVLKVFYALPSRGEMGTSSTWKNPYTGQPATLHHLITGLTGLHWSIFYPNPAGMDGSLCTITAMNTLFSAANCHKLSGEKLKEWCSRPDAHCMNPAASGKITDAATGSGKTSSAGFVGYTGPVDPDPALPPDGQHYLGSNKSPCDTGGTPIDISTFGVYWTDPTPIDNLSNWKVKDPSNLKTYDANDTKPIDKK